MIDRSEVSQMSKFMAALDGESSIDGAATVSNLAVNEMKVILERFHAATDNVLNDAPHDAELREAFITEGTDSGARIGVWEIQTRQHGKRRFYDVVHVETQEQLAADLMLYEAAHGLVRILNGGGHINCREAVELLGAEQDYAASVNDMVLFRHRLTKQPDSRRANILEARYSDAKHRAIRAKASVQRLFDRRL